MAARIEAFAVTVAAGTAKTAPASTALTFADGTLLKITITVPPGPSGLMGFQIAQSGVVIIPRTGGQFIVANDRVIQWELHGYPSGGKYSVVAYNTDVYAHTLYVEIELDELAKGAPSSIDIVPITPPDQSQPIDIGPFNPVPVPDFTPSGV